MAEIKYLYIVKKRTVLLAALLLLPGFLSAQEFPDYESYARAAGEDMPILRSRVADNYGNRYNGTYLADTLGFLPGHICLEGKTYHNLSLNLDAVLQHVLLRQGGIPYVLDLGLERIQSFTRGSKTYVNLPSLGYSLPDGFYEIMAEGRGAVYKRVSKELHHLTDLNHDARRSIGYDDPDYRPDLFEYFEHKESWYWIREDGSVQRLRSRRKIRNALQTVQNHETH